MKKILLIVLLITSLLTCSCSLSAVRHVDPPAFSVLPDDYSRLDDIYSRGVLSVACSPDYPPYAFSISQNDSLSFAGSDIALASYIANCLGVSLDLYSVAYNEIFDAVSSGKYDLAISAISLKPDRQDISFSSPYTLTNPSDPTSALYICSSTRGSIPLIAAVNACIADIIETGAYDQWYNEASYYAFR